MKKRQRLNKHLEESRSRAELIRDRDFWRGEAVRSRRSEHERNAEVARYVALFDAAPVGYASLDNNGCILAINLTGATLLGCRPRALRGRPLCRLVAAPDRRKFLRHLSALRRRVVRLSINLLFERADKSTICVQVVSESSLDPAGRPGPIRMIMTDRTAEKRTEELLHESQEQLAAIAVSAMDAILTVDRGNGLIIQFNPAAANMFCCPAQHAIGQPVGQFFAPVHIGPNGRLNLLTTIEGTPRDLTAAGALWALRMDGMPFPVEGSAARLELGDRRLVTMILRDASERHHMQAQLRTSTQRLDLAHRAARLGTFEWDLRTNQIHCSPLTEQIYGLSPGSLQGDYDKWLKVLHFEDVRRVAAEMRQAVADQEYLELEFRLAPRNGEVQWIQARCQVSRDAQGRPDGMAGLHFDITPVKRLAEVEREITRTLERRVDERTRELFEANTALRSEVEQRRYLQRQLLEIAERERRRIGQDLHDDLGQQLTGLMLLSDSLAGKLAARATPEEAEARRLVALVTEAQAQARGLARGLLPVRAEADGLITALDGLAQSVSERHHVKCLFEYDPGALVGDNTVGTHLFRIAQEAVNNALRHGKSHRIELSLRRCNGSLRLAVRDNGCGIPPNGNGKPAGLGLPIMRSRCEAIGASLKVESVRPHGTLVECVVSTHPTPQKGPKLNHARQQTRYSHTSGPPQGAHCR
jgi:PAS domain S-box-containing protein